MQETVVVTLPSETKQALDEITQEEGLSISEFIDKAVKEYLFIRRFRRLRERMILRARDQGIYTDQDVFDRVS